MVGLHRFRDLTHSTLLSYSAQYMTSPFQNPDAWSGGTFDALMFFGPTTLNQTIEIARHVWRYPNLNGPYRERHVLPSQQRKATLDFTEDGCEQLVGECRHQDGSISTFVHTTIRCDDGLWVYAGIPMGGFSNSWDVGAYPFDDGKPLGWIIDLIDELQRFTSFIRDSYPVRAAAFGWFDVSILDTIEDAMNGTIHDDRWHHLELETDDGWKAYPITRLEPLFTNAG